MKIPISEKVRVASRIDESLNQITDVKMRDFIRSLTSGAKNTDRSILTRYYHYFPISRPVDWEDEW